MLFVAPPPKRYNVLNMILVEMFVCLFVIHNLAVAIYMIHRLTHQKPAFFCEQMFLDVR